MNTTYLKINENGVIVELTNVYESVNTIITIPSKIDGITVTGIGSWVFEELTNLKAIVIPSTVTTIESDAFTGCNSLETVYYTGTEEQWKKINIMHRNHTLSKAKIIFNS